MGPKDVVCSFPEPVTMFIHVVRALADVIKDLEIRVDPGSSRWAQCVSDHRRLLEEAEQRRRRRGCEVAQEVGVMHCAGGGRCWKPSCAGGF